MIIKPSLDDLLDEISVHDLDPEEMQDDMSGYHYAVDDENGIIAYFKDRETALFFRLALINARLNPLT